MEYKRSMQAVARSSLGCGNMFEIVFFLFSVNIIIVRTQSNFSDETDKMQYTISKLTLLLLLSRTEPN